MPKTSHVMPLVAVCLLLALDEEAWAAGRGENPVAGTPDILLLTDTEFSPIADSLMRLYPGRVRAVPLAKEPCPAKGGVEFRYLVSAVAVAANLDRLDRGLFTEFGRLGRTVITGLDEYARFRGAEVKRTPVLAKYRTFDPGAFREAWQMRSVPPATFRLLGEDRVLNKPAMRFVAARPWTQGFHVGDCVPWFGLIDPASKYSATSRERQYTEDPEYQKWRRLRLDVSIENMLWKEWETRAERRYYQLRLARLPSDFRGEVLGVSSEDACPVLVEEPLGQGRWIALDLLGPEEPMFHPHFGEGSLNKYVLIGNLCGRTVEHGRFWTCWPTPGEVNQWMRTHAAKHPKWTLLREVEYDYDPAGVESERQALGLPAGLLKSHYENCSLNLGDRSRPLWLLVGATHGPESVGTLGLLSLVESITERLPHDEPLQRFLEHYCLKVYPINNPLDYTSLIYRDPWAGPGWTMKNVNPESAGYRVFLGHDIHGNPGTCAGIQQGNGRWVEEAVRQCNAKFQDRYLESPHEASYGVFTGYGNAVGEMRPRLRRCIYPRLDFRDYSMGTEMPDCRMGIFGGDSVVLKAADGKAYGLNRGKLWPLQTYFTLPVTEVVATYLYVEMMPHPWADTRLTSPDPAWEARLWRYHPEQKDGVMITTFRRADARHITDWEYLDVVRVGREPPTVKTNPLDGRLHTVGTLFSYPLRAGGLRSNRVWREEDNAGPTFLRWHWLQDPDAFRPLVGSHWVLWDIDDDAQPDVYLEDRDNDGLYETRRPAPRGGLPWAAGYYAGRSGHRGWADLSAHGFSSLGTWIQARGGTVRMATPEDSWDDLRLLVVGDVTHADLTSSLIQKLRTFAERGGRLVIAMPDLLEPFPNGKEPEKRAWWMKKDGEVDWQAAMRKDQWSPTALYERRLLPYARLAAALGVLPHPRVAGNCQRIHGEWCWLDPFFREKAGFEDRTGLGLIGEHAPLMLQSFVLEPTSDAMRPLLLLGGEPVLVGGRLGRGYVLVSGSADLLRNRAISEKLHEPADWNQPSLPPPARNIALRGALVQALLDDSLPVPSPWAAVTGSQRDIAVGHLAEDIRVTWKGADGQPRHFTIHDCPSPGTPGYGARIHLGMGVQERWIELKAVPHILNRARVDLQIVHHEGLEIIFRDKHEFYPRRSDVFEEYRFSFRPGKDYFLVRYRLVPSAGCRPFGRGPFSLAQIEGQEDWQVTTDKNACAQTASNGKVFFGFLSKKGNVLAMSYHPPVPIDYEVVVFCGAGEPAEGLGRVRSATFAELAASEPAQPHPLEAVWRRAAAAIDAQWRSRARQMEWLPETSEVMQRWAVDHARQALLDCRSARAALYLQSKAESSGE